MSTLHESVIIRTGAGPNLHGELFVGEDGLPELEVSTTITLGGFCGSDTKTYRPATFPAAWRLLTVSPYQGVLYDAWVALTTLRDVIAKAQREAERETPEPEDDITASKRERALEEE